MRFECGKCGHLGEAARVQPCEGGVELVCQECGAGTPLQATASLEPSTMVEAPPLEEPATLMEAPPLPKASALEPATQLEAPPQEKSAVEQNQDPTPPWGDVNASATLAAFLEQSGDRSPDPMKVLDKSGIRVDPGEGPMRCPKCGFRQPEAPSCKRCGLGIEGLGPGPHAWERVEAGQEADVAALDAGWDELVKEKMLDFDAREALIHAAVQKRLLDRLARKFRFYAQDHHGTPEGDAAQASLGRIVEKMHATFMVSQGGGESSDYEGTVKRLKGGLYVAAAAMFLVVLVLAISIFKPF